MSFSKKSLKNQAILIGLIFFVVGLFTLTHYGINWDTINHLPRGQAYLHFFLTGRKDFSDLRPFKSYWQDPDSLFVKSDIPRKEIPTRSLYQSDGTTFNWFIENERGGHPPLSDIFSALSNEIFFQKLRLINDIDSYRVYGLFLSAVLAALVYYWVSKKYGKIPGLVAAISLAAYPLFWAEAHFNGEKDIPETVFWALTAYFFWRGITEKKVKNIFISSIFFGFALGTKFNILFIAFVFVPWLLVYYWGHLVKNSKFLLSLFLIPVVGFLIFFISWPHLWGDPIGAIVQVLRFYQGLGLTESINPEFVGPFRINTYPIKWILFTTPEIILVLTAVGIVKALSLVRKEKDKLALLILLWFFVPILRVTWPGTTIYGGIRQVMEFVPAMAILAGLGAGQVATLIEKLNIKYQNYIFKFKIIKHLFLNFNLYFCTLIFALLIYPLTKIHPNENVYFNSLAGGLQGAKEKNLPSWGNSFGAAYRQGISWINKNAEKNANLVLAHELLPNIPNIFVRSDINFHNSERSGYLRNGEYAITLVYEGTEDRSYYDMYLEKFIEPVYEVKVDGVSTLKVWKNDEGHLKEKIQESTIQDAKLMNKEDYLLFDLGGDRKISRLEINYSDADCAALSRGIVRISEDGQNWIDLPGVLPKSWRISKLGEQPKDGHFIEPFVGQEARFIQIVVSPVNTCLKSLTSFSVFEFLPRN